MLGVVGSPNMRLVLNPEGGALGEPTAASWRGEHPVLAGFQVMCLDSMQRLGSSSSVQYVQLIIYRSYKYLMVFPRLAVPTPLS